MSGEAPGTHPYSTQFYGGLLKFHKSLKDAKTSALSEVRRLSRNVWFTYVSIEDAVNALGVDGGSVDEILDERSGLRFRVTIRKRF